MSERTKIPAEEIETRCKYDDDGLHNWNDITAFSDPDHVEMCVNCNLERRRPRGEDLR